MATKKTAKKKVAKKTAKKAPAKKKASTSKKKAPAKKKAASAPKKRTAAKKAGPKRGTRRPVVSDEARYIMIQEAAYYAAERSGFHGDPSAYWIQAEAEVRARLGR